MNVADALLICHQAPGQRRLRVSHFPEASMGLTALVGCGVASFFVLYFGLLLLFFTVGCRASTESCSSGRLPFQFTMDLRMGKGSVRLVEPSPSPSHSLLMKEVCCRQRRQRRIRVGCPSTAVNWAAGAANYTILLRPQKGRRVAPGEMTASDSF